MKAAMEAAMEAAARMEAAAIVAAREAAMLMAARKPMTHRTEALCPFSSKASARLAELSQGLPILAETS